jgi:MFS family permease
MGQETPSTLRQSSPLLITTFINRCGTIGLSLLPMLLVQNKFSDATSSTVMTLVKVALLVGTYLGGWAADRMGMKASVLLSFLLSGIGLAFLPFGDWAGWVGVDAAVWIGVWAVLAQLGGAMFYSPARIMVVELVPVEKQQESIGWLKTANNLGNIFSYVFGALFSTWGLIALILFDSITSLAAAAVGVKLLPNLGKHDPAKKAERKSHPGGSWFVFVFCTLTVAGFFFFYDLFMVSISAKCQDVFGAEGLRLFSEAMVVNTVLCTLFVVLAAKYLHRPGLVFPASIVLMAAGTALIAWVSTSWLVLFLAMLVVSVAEILFAALAQFVIIRSTPESKNQGVIYGASLVVQSLARILGAAVAFPLVVHSDNPLPFIAVSASALLAVSFFARPPRPAEAAKG